MCLSACRSAALELCIKLELPAGELAEGEKALETLLARLAAEEAERREAAGELESLTVSKLTELEPLRAAFMRAEAAGVEEVVMLPARMRLEELEAEEAERLEAEEMLRVEEEEKKRLEEEVSSVAVT